MKKMKRDPSKKEYDLLIIGGGPAGLTAAAYAIRKRIDTMLVSEDLGGKTNYKFTVPGVETHPIIDGEELVSKFKSQLQYLDFARHLDRVTKIDRTSDGFTVSTRGGAAFRGRAAIIAIGIMPKRLNVPGEKEFLGRGVSYSAVSHAPLFIDMDVTVVGEGTPALQAVAELAQIANCVNAVGTSSKLADSDLGQKLKASGKVKFLTDCEVEEIRGKASVEEVLIRNKLNKSQQIIPAKGVFIELGYETDKELYSHMVKTTVEGRIMISENNQTNIPGLFAAGDITDVNAQQVVIAIGEGANAALSAYNYLLGLKTR
jgi:alkyl hydroperoxide reductase subunit F